MTTYRKCLIRKKPLKNNGPQGADVEYGGEGDRKNANPKQSELVR